MAFLLLAGCTGRGGEEVEEVYFQAHRGAVDEAPENTLAGLRHAWRFPGAVPEVDVRATRDGALVCLHDETLRRTTDAPDSLADVPVDRLSLEEVQQWDAGSWFGPRFAGARVPSLDSVLALMRDDPGRRLYLDLKDVDLVALRELVGSYGLQDRVLFVHGEPERLLELRRLFPDAPTMTWLSGDREAQARRFEELAASGFEGISQLQFHLPALDTVPEIRYAWSPDELAAFAARLEDAGVALQVRPFVFDARALRALLDAGVRWYVADAPEAFARALDEARRLPG